MKALRSLLNNKKFSSPTVLDDKTVFYVFKKVIKEDFGNIGIEKFVPDYFAKGILFIKPESSAWAAELWMNKKRIIRKINEEIGEDALSDIKAKQ
ncbi:MAG: DUF721 domain-containing protein [Candidatus Moranbacteria bacterium]|nr:DUF721 domain-containing protein [Candidatus Moranbacteria bacterium]